MDRRQPFYVKLVIADGERGKRRLTIEVDNPSGGPVMATPATLLNEAMKSLQEMGGAAIRDWYPASPVEGKE